jgi:hypothetical protein
MIIPSIISLNIRTVESTLSPFIATALKLASVMMLLAMANDL